MHFGKRQKFSFSISVALWFSDHLPATPPKENPQGKLSEWTTMDLKEDWGWGGGGNSGNF